MNVANGRAVDFTFGNVTGRSRLVDRDGQQQIAIFADIRVLRRVTAGTLDGVAYHVVGLAPSDFNKKMVVLTVAPLEQDEA